MENPPTTSEELTGMVASSVTPVEGGFIHDRIEAREFGRLRHAMADMEIHDLAELLAAQADDDLAVAFRLLPTDRAAEMLGYLDPDQQEHLLTTLKSDKVAELITSMPPDDRTELLEEIPGQLAQRLINHLRGDDLRKARQLLGYPEDSIGRLMTPEYVAVRKDWTIDHVLRHIRRIGAKRETFNVIYVVDETWHLQDDLYLEDVILAEPEQTVEEFMDEQGGYLVATDDQEAAIEAFKKYDAFALPVVDSRGVLVGIVTHDDVMDVQEEEDTEDMQKMAGMAALEDPYLSAGFVRIMTKRLPWLLLLLIVETGAVLVLKGFDRWLAILALFMPMINATAGNTGSQVAGLMIRSIALAEVKLSDWWRVLGSELLRGLVMGLLLAVVAACIVLAIGSEQESDGLRVSVRQLALAASLAMVAAVTLANVLGSMLPFFFKRIGMDPAVTSGPFIACLMDISSILIFFSIATTVLRVLG